MEFLIMLNRGFQACLVNSVPSSDRLMFMSWLCRRYGQPKCASLTGKTGDAMVDTKKGLRWSFPECRKEDIEFYNLFTQTKKQFAKKILEALVGNFVKKGLNSVRLENHDSPRVKSYRTTSSVAWELSSTGAMSTQMWTCCMLIWSIRLRQDLL